MSPRPGRLVGSQTWDLPSSSCMGWVGVLTTVYFEFKASLLSLEVPSAPKLLATYCPILNLTKKKNSNDTTKALEKLSLLEMALLNIP